MVEKGCNSACVKRWRKKSTDFADRRRWRRPTATATKSHLASRLPCVICCLSYSGDVPIAETYPSAVRTRPLQSAALHRRIGVNRCNLWIISDRTINPSAPKSSKATSAQSASALRLSEVAGLGCVNSQSARRYSRRFRIRFRTC